ncbi:Shedu anti-phage system protein SduA domain-containing protein [Streptomyces monomycini]|uniref:Shedu anti-phage system protein SduA domain-containing protein n=1 Tax=Streptomyces monomycini TaxID=371720 RepID=UPI0004ABD04D|nr:Shedu anti-phage system protein SduA domain-containing protein [Streptomyces monomycini]
MTVRSDFALELQLERTREEAADIQVKGAVNAVVEHMSSGGGRSRRGGRALTDLLAAARVTAADKDEWHVVRLLQDSLDYAEGRILRPEFEERYRLFQDGARNEAARHYLARTIGAASDFVLRAGREFLASQPGAGAEKLLSHVEKLSKEAQWLNAPEDRPGRYRILRGRAEIAVWTERILRNRVDMEDPDGATRHIISILASDPEGKVLLQALQLQRRSAGLIALRRLAEDPHASERDLHEALRGQHWIFGGQFISEATHRRLVPGDELDIPLIRGDGSLHVVELKRAAGLRGPLVKRHRDAWVPTAEVHDAVAQAVNYLVGLDEHRERIRRDLHIETRRASALVLIGHPAAQPDVPEEEINEAFRTLNTHLNRVEVLTYKDLIDNAERLLTPTEDA